MKVVYRLHTVCIFGVSHLTNCDHYINVTPLYHPNCVWFMILGPEKKASAPPIQSVQHLKWAQRVVSHPNVTFLPLHQDTTNSLQPLSSAPLRHSRVQTKTPHTAATTMLEDNVLL